MYICRVCYVLSWYGPSWLLAELVMRRVCYMPSWPGTTKCTEYRVFTVYRSILHKIYNQTSICFYSEHPLIYRYYINFIQKMAVFHFPVFKTNSNHKWKVYQFNFSILIVIICCVGHICCDLMCNGLICHNGTCKQNGTICECHEGWSGPSCSHCSGRVKWVYMDIEFWAQLF